MKTLQKNAPGKKSFFLHFFPTLVQSIKNLFEPEEVEVTFKTDGDKTKYTYTVIDHHQHAA
jgi:hypothetical protein